MSKRRSRRSRTSPRLPEPSEAQLFEALLAFETLKMRYVLEANPNAPPDFRYVVRVMPEGMGGGFVASLQHLTEPSVTFSLHRFTSEDAARRWREHEIVRETIKAAMRAKA